MLQQAQRWLSEVAERYRSVSLIASVAAIFLCVILGIAFAADLSPQVRGSLITAAATICVGTIAALMVVYQLGRQARFATEQTRETEAMKLKLVVYDEVAAACRQAEMREVNLSSFVRAVPMQFIGYDAAIAAGAPGTVPKSRAAKLLKLRSQLSRAVSDLFVLIEKWEIIDSRLCIFRFWFSAAEHEINEAFQAYFELALRTFPRDDSNAPSRLQWNYPTAPDRAALEAAGDKLTDKLMTLGGFVADFRTEMQNILVGELFGKRAAPRRPLDPAVVVLELDRFDELSRRLEGTSWGHVKAEAEERVSRDTAAAHAR